MTQALGSLATEGIGTGLPEGLHHPAAQGARCGHRDLLTQDGAYGQFEAVHCARHPQTAGLGQVGLQRRGHRLRVSVQIEQGPHAGHHRRQHRQQTLAHPQAHTGVRRVELQREPASVFLPGHGQPQGAGHAQAGAVDHLHPRQRPRRQKPQQSVQVQGR